MQWDGNTSIILDVMTCLGVALPVEVKNIAFAGTFRLIFRRLVDEFPCFGAVYYSLRQKKKLDYTLKVFGGDMTAIPGVSDAIEAYRCHGYLAGVAKPYFEVVATRIGWNHPDAVEDSIMWPVRKVIRILPGDHSLLPGSIHPNSILYQLHHLQTLNLAYNDVYPSSIPHNIGGLTNLRHLNLSDAWFQGKIPTEISYLSNLVSLDLSNSYALELDERTFETMLQNLTNLEAGEIPDSIGNFSSLKYLNLQQCQFSGSIPDSIGNLTLITELDLSYNHFTGRIIPSTISKFKHLTRLDLSSNSFSGEIPDVFSNLQKLRYLDFFNNSFIGPFPASILSLTRLEHLGLSSNSLSGPLPSNTSMLPKLIHLNLSYNSLNGTIPSWVFSLPLLYSVSLQHNRFRGLADEVIKTNPTLKELHLSNNQLSGSFPQSLANLTNLETLGISSNNITVDEGMNITFLSLSSLFLSSCQLKHFPYFLRNVNTLVYLDISNNKISGQIPNWFSGMRWDSLIFLNLSHNSLTGNLPQFRYDNLGYLDLKFNSLQGPLPSSICNMSKLMLLDLSHNYLSNSVPHCLGSMGLLTALDLKRNNLTCYGLEVLDVGNNAINDTFPAWLGILQELQVLILKSNKFHGPISTCHTEFCFTKLRIFDLSRNDFSGSLPAKVFGNFKAMIKLDGEDIGNIKYMTSLLNSPFVTSYENSVSLVIKGQDL
uniref:SMP-LTD domain-containing protein n=1 Tax=Solanum lycopersicum TaxID=4081 RepID=A0A3Q7J389_SOLLC